MPQTVAVLVSGSATILEAMIAAKLRIALVIADRTRNCRGEELATKAGIPFKLIERKDFTNKFDRKAYTCLVIEELKKHQITLVAMAGFMTVFSEEMFLSNAYEGKILNIHPSLLPSFKGDHAVKDALEYGVKITGTTIHIATKELDAGPILAQRAVPVLDGDTKETLHERIKQVERQLYPEIVQDLVNQ